MAMFPKEGDGLHRAGKQFPERIGWQGSMVLRARNSNPAVGAASPFPYASGTTCIITPHERSLLQALCAPSR